MGIARFLHAPMVNEAEAPQRKQSRMWLVHRGVDASIVPASSVGAKPLSKSQKEQPARHHQRPQRRARADKVAAEAAELKARIQSRIHKKFVYFDFLVLKRMAEPPVAIPRSLATPNARTGVVAGKSVPMTRAMWRNQRRHALNRMPESIFEE